MKNFQASLSVIPVLSLVIPAYAGIQLMGLLL